MLHHANVHHTKTSPAASVLEQKKAGIAEEELAKDDGREKATVSGVKMLRLKKREISQ